MQARSVEPAQIEMLAAPTPSCRGLEVVQHPAELGAHGAGAEVDLVEPLIEHQPRDLPARLRAGRLG
jgi:hypothetical protein